MSSDVAAAAAECEALLKPGGSAVIRNLKAKPELNGKSVSVLSYDGSRGRWNVQVAQPFTVLALKADNLLAK